MSALSSFLSGRLGFFSRQLVAWLAGFFYENGFK
jgi:hypothetical protein